MGCAVKTTHPLLAITGDVIDSTIGVTLGISTLAAAALGNSFSNGVARLAVCREGLWSWTMAMFYPLVLAGLGMVLHGAIERFASTLGLPDPRLTTFQRRSNVVKNVRMVAGIIGVLSGCLLGMFPLLFLNAPNSHEKVEEPRW